jgi:hypothetical protein
MRRAGWFPVLGAFSGLFVMAAVVGCALPPRQVPDAGGADVHASDVSGTDGGLARDLAVDAPADVPVGQPDGSPIDGAPPPVDAAPRDAQGGDMAVGPIFFDPFDGTMLASFWGSADPGALVGGGVLIISASSPTAGSFQEVQSAQNYDFHQRFVQVKVVSAADQGAQTILKVNVADGTNSRYVQWETDSDQLHCYLSDGQTGSDISQLQYNPQVHVYWRLRADRGGTIYCDTSSNGTDFTTQGTTTATFPLDRVDLELLVGGSGNFTTPVSAIFDDFTFGAW